ncbi:DUF6585 family protein [Kitasatospora sp. NPDC058170]|uniref:DUF6585 family protein n=1 Tax=Kitasatospora sp. NPDC058170 TaxID=3346364 RepID=UPI0036D7A6BF
MTEQESRANGRPDGSGHGRQGGQGGQGGGNSDGDGVDRFLSQIDEAAARERLGGRRAVYPGTQSQSGSLGCAVTGIVVLGGIALALSQTAAAVMAVLPLGLLLVVPFAIWHERSTSRKNRGLRIDLFDHGLTAVVQGRVHTVRYESTSVLQHIVRHTGAGGYTAYEYTVTDTEGGRVVLRGRADRMGEVAEKGKFGRPQDWGPAIQNAVTRAQLPGAAAAMESGGRLDFGPLWMTRDEIGSARGSVPWHEIEQIRAANGIVTVKVAGRRRGPVDAAVSRIPNLSLFLTLAERRRANGRRPAA